MIGRVISGRYVIQAIVGTGGMAVVYRAFDKKKNRIVAIKVLRPEFESDEEFVRRFSREAEAASKVSHENIVNMLDVGTDGDLRYIVMEYVDGQTLKDMIRQQGFLNPDTAIRMTIRILAAVDHAHRNGIVHRDIKPQNILVDADGHVKVADFGIARLKAAQTTRVDSDGQGISALGSVHYFSPEQARGEVADEKSDLYSVGVVMYEMLTGQVPFDGETSVSVALKHVHEAPKSMREHRANISKALDEVVMRALCKDATKRYQTAAEMAADLRKTITHPEGGFVKYPKAPEEIEKEREARRRKRARDRKRLQRTITAVAALITAALVAFTVWFILKIINTYSMPNVLGQEQMLALDRLENLNATTEVEYSYSEEFEEGVVMAQSHRAGVRVKYATPVTVTVSLGSQWYYMEDYLGAKVDGAVEALTAQGVESIEVEYVQSDNPAGTIVAVEPDIGTQSKDTPVLLVVSGQRIIMPLLTGRSLESARALLNAEGLAVGNISEGYSADAKAGIVIAQSVAANSQVLAGTSVDLTINQAQQPVYYPASKLSVVVPLNGTQVRVQIRLSTGEVQEVYQGVLNTGTYRIALSSSEPGVHAVDISMDGVLMDEQNITFE
ncbi:MAG: protein kinase [Clostridia bacterium]|nr:protein kinase [Clostridia bacterium]